MRGTTNGGASGGTGADGPAAQVRVPRPADPELATRQDIDDLVESMAERFAAGTAFGTAGTDDPGEQEQAVVAGPVDAALEISTVTGIEVDPRDILAAAMAGAAPAPDVREPARRAPLAEVAWWLSLLGRPPLRGNGGEEPEPERIAARRRRARCYELFVEPAAPDLWARWRSALLADADRLESAWRRTAGQDTPLPEWEPAAGLGYPLSTHEVDLARLSADMGDQWDFRRTTGNPRQTPRPEEEDSVF